MLTVYFVVVLGLLVLILTGTIIGMTQGLDKLKDPFLDTLANYDESRQTIVELTWDQTQSDICIVIPHPLKSVPLLWC